MRTTRFTTSCTAFPAFSPRSCLSHRKLRDRRQLMSTKAPVSKTSSRAARVTCVGLDAISHRHTVACHAARKHITRACCATLERLLSARLVCVRHFSVHHQLTSFVVGRFEKEDQPTPLLVCASLACVPLYETKKDVARSAITCVWPGRVAYEEGSSNWTRMQQTFSMDSYHKIRS